MTIDYTKIPYLYLREVAEDILEDFPDVGMQGHPAYPYWRAMSQLTDIDEMYGSDPASSVIAYFLSNADDWDTDRAKKIKGYLNKLLDAYNNQ